MQINTNGMPCEGATLCGATLRPADDDSQWGVVHRGTFTCGFTVETGRSNPFLRMTPAVQVPQFCREGFERWQFEHDDESMMDLALDERDGEVVVRRDLKGLEASDVEPVLSELLDWLETTGVPAVKGYIAASLATA